MISNLDASLFETHPLFSKNSNSQEGIPKADPSDLFSDNNSNFSIESISLFTKDHLSNHVQFLAIADDSCNDIVYPCFSQYNMVKAIHIGQNCFQNAVYFSVEYCSELTTLSIQRNSFTSLNWETTAFDN